MSLCHLPVTLLREEARGMELTERERIVLKRYAMGDQGPEVADHLSLSHQTIKDSTKVIRAKLGAKTTAHAVAVAISLDLI